MPPPTPDDRVEALAARAAAGEDLSREDAAALCAGDPLALGGIADGLRRSLHGNRAYLVRIHIVGWGDEVPAAVDADEVRIEGPLPEGATAADLRATLRRASAARAPVRARRPAEVPALARAAGLTGRVLLARLADAGLATLAHPGAGDDPAATREGLLAAHGAGLATDAPLPYGARTAPEALADLLLGIRALPGAADRFRCAVPLPDSTPEQSPLTGTTGLQDLRVVACARILLPPPIRVAVEAGPLGARLAAVALSFGADTLAGALAAPTVRPTPATADLPRPFDADRARRLLAEAGREPVLPPPFPARDA